MKTTADGRLSRWTRLVEVGAERRFQISLISLGNLQSGPSIFTLSCTFKLPRYGLEEARVPSILQRQHGRSESRCRPSPSPGGFLGFHKARDWCV